MQHRASGNADIGRELYPLLTNAGFNGVKVSPLVVHVDGIKPELVDGFTRKTFTAMIEGISDSAIDAGLIDPADMLRGICGLYRTTDADGVFCYTFFKALAVMN